MSKRIEQIGDPPRYNGFMTFKDDGGNGHNTGTVKVERDMRVCVWCAGNNREGCINDCQPGGKYLHLEPVPLERWETGPELPAFDEVVDMTPACRLALLYLMAYYADYRDRRE